MAEAKQENFFPTPKSGERPFWAIRSSVEGNLGIVALAGIIDYDQGEAILEAANPLIENRDVDCIVFDFLNAEFFHADHMKILTDIYDRTIKAGKKTFMFRNLINPSIEHDNTNPDITPTGISQLIKTNPNLAIADEHPPEVLARLLDFKPHNPRD